MLLFSSAFALSCALQAGSHAQAAPASPALPCRIEATNYKGWQAQQVSNRWLQLIVVPQNGGRLMQVTFDGHAYLFVNPRYAGKYLPPTANQWFNYGGDKIWLLPEGNNDEQHWVGNSDLLDDGPYDFRKVSEGTRCQIELTSPADPQTGVQFQRTIEIESVSPRIGFRTTMKNITGHSLEWSMQSVSQYDTADPSQPSRRNNEFWSYTPANSSSAYLNRYHVRFGPAHNPSASVRTDGLFALQYAHAANEFWLDSTGGWVAVINGESQYAMVERFHYEEGKAYPGKASVIFWTNGPEVSLDGNGEARLSTGGEGESPYYEEAELNSPLCRLAPGESCTFQTEWFPVRSAKEFYGVSEAGIINQPLRATRLPGGKVSLSGSFGVFYPGRLIAHFYNGHGAALVALPISDVVPTKLAVVEKQVTPSEDVSRVSLHLKDDAGLDRGSLQEVLVSAEARPH